MRWIIGIILFLPILLFAQYGNNEITNGTFGDATGWTLSGTAAIQGDTLLLIGTGASGNHATFIVSTFVAGDVYKFEYDVTHNSLSVQNNAIYTGGTGMEIDGGTQYFQAAHVTVASHTMTLTALGTTNIFRLRTAGGLASGNIGWDNLIYRKKLDTLYIDPTNGNNDSLGTITAPIQTWAEAMSRGTYAGGVFMQRTGTTAREQVTISGSGSSGLPVAVSCYDSATGLTGAAALALGDTATINGADLVTGWTAIDTGETGGLFASSLETEINAFTTEFDSKTEASSNVMTVQTSQFKSGTKGGQIAFAGSGVGTYATKAFTAQADVYARMYFKLNDGFVSESSGYENLDILNLYDGGSICLRVLLSSVGSTTLRKLKVTVNTGNTVIYNGSTGQIVDDTWYCVEVHYVQDGSVGGAQVWLDGDSLEAKFDLNTPGEPDDFYVGQKAISSFVPTSASIMYFDLIKVDTVAIGTYDLPADKYYNLGISTEPKIVLFDGTPGVKSASSAVVDTQDEWFWTTAGSDSLWIFTSTAADTSNIEAGQRDYGIDARNKEYLTIEEIEVSGANKSNIVLGATTGDMEGYIFTNIRSRSAAEHGLWSGNSGGYTLSDITVTGGRYDHNGGGGINLGGPNLHTILFDSVTANNNCLDPSQTYTGGIRVVPGDRSAYGLITQYCTTYSNGRNDAGEDVANAQSGYGIWYDTVHDSTDTTPTVVRYNISYDNTHTGLFAENSYGTQWYYNIAYSNTHCGLQASCSITAYPSEENKFYNNVLYGNGAGIYNYGKYQETGTLTSVNNIFKNNISYGNTTYSLDCINGGANDSTASGWGSGNVFTYNAFGVEITNFIRWQATHSNYAAWYGVYAAADRNTIESDPLFTDAANNDFTLQVKSPCIDKAFDWGQSQDYSGNGKSGLAWDIGAFESSHVLGGKGFKRFKMFKIYKVGK